MTDIETDIIRRMVAGGCNTEIIQEFTKRVHAVIDGDTGKIRWEEILDLRPEDLVKLNDLDLSGNAAEQMNSLVVIKLNGGLGTSMGLTKAKTIIPIHDGKNFLQIIREQTDLLRERWKTQMPLIFMNSYNTQADFDSEKSMQGLNSDFPGSFLQNKVPRLYEDSLFAVGDGRSEDHWCPPGHGDIFLSLMTTGILEKLLSTGKKVVFISNGDNLGATVDERVLGYFISSGLEFAMEVTPKSKADLKGGVLFRRRGHRNISLLETAQVEAEHLKDFEDTARFPFFSINNLWVNLEVLRDKLKTGGLDLSLIVNPKQYQGKNVLQLEAAMGSACQSFANMKVIRVDRDRFAPVKNCSDLLVRRSDACIIRETDRALVLLPERNFGEPIVKLDDSCKKLDEFDAQFPSYPSLAKADSLTVTGKVLFDTHVTIVGSVKIENRSGNTVPVSQIGRSTLENEEISL